MSDEEFMNVVGHPFIRQMELDRELQRMESEKNELTAKSKKLGNWRTGLMAGGVGTNKLMCGDVKCSCVVTACENGYYLAANAKGWSMGWCRSGNCPRGKHPNIVNGNRMTGCIDD